MRSTVPCVPSIGRAVAFVPADQVERATRRRPMPAGTVVAAMRQASSSHGTGVTYQCSPQGRRNGGSFVAGRHIMPGVPFDTQAPRAARAADRRHQWLDRRVSSIWDVSRHGCRFHDGPANTGTLLG
jgi:hypothetical protein